MNDALEFPAPILDLKDESDPDWEREHRSFLSMRDSLQLTHAGQVVAVHNGQVVASGKDELAVAVAAYRKCGYVPIYVGPVEPEQERVVRVPSPRTLSLDG